MKPRATALKTAVVIGLLCLFALGRVAYAAQQCYRLTGGGCGGGGVEQAVDSAHEQPHGAAKVCAEVMEAPDDRGSASLFSLAALAIAPAQSLAFVAAPPYEALPTAAVGPPLTPFDVLTRFGRLRL